MANPHVVNAKPTEAIDELAAHNVFDDRALTRPLDGGKVFGLGDGLAIVQKAAIKIVVEILQRVGNDAILVFGIELLSTTDDFQIVSRLAPNLLEFGSFRYLA